MKPGMEWQFGGLLQGLHPFVAWGILGLAAVIGLAVVTVSYRHTLRVLPPAGRWSLTALRVALLLAVLLCLANPVRIEKAARDKKPSHKLAVLIDRSASMDAIDNRNETRLGNALRIWRQHGGEAAEKFDAVEYYRFSTKLDPIPTLDAAATAGAPGSETHLYTALDQALAGSPSAIVCLTDGLDTTEKGAADLIARAQREGVPLYFVAARNRSRPGELLNIREVKAPSRVLRQTRFSAGVALEIAAAKDGEVPVELWSGDQKLAETRLPVRAGWNSLPWTVDVTSGEAGTMPLEFRAGPPGKQEISASTTQIIGKATVDVLYYQGALQWGYRFLLTALQSDPSFRMASILNPALGMKMTSPVSGHTTLSDLPEDAAELKQYQIVILAHVFADQLSAKQQQALIDYTKSGGGVLFITPDTEASKQFAGTPLEQMLPIVFEPSKKLSQQDAAIQTFQEHMQAIGGSRAADETEFADHAMSRQDTVGLTPFYASRGSASAKLFQVGPNAPQFSEYAQVKSAKPGAEVIAVHPRDRTSDGASRVLVARQQFGSGFTAAMTTDLLWRWKLSLPSSSRVVETFWQQFMLSLAPPASGLGLRIFRTGDSATTTRPVSVHIEGSSSEAPKVEAVNPQGTRQTLNARAASTQGATAWDASFTPDLEGRWEIVAANSAGDRARISLPVSRQVRTLETVNFPPDLEGMRRMAEATGGVLIESEAAAFAPPPGLDRALESKQSQPLWNTNWLIALLLGVYGTELITRRLFRLL